MPYFVQFELPTSADGRYMSFCSKHQMLHHRRLLLGLTQEKLSDMTKISVQQIQKLEAGELAISRLGLKKGLALCAALLLDPYEMADVNYEQPSILALQSMPPINSNNVKMLDKIDAETAAKIETNEKSITDTDEKKVGREPFMKDAISVYFNQPFRSSMLISRKVLELLNKPNHVQIRWDRAKKRLYFTGTETTGMFSFDVPSKTYDEENIGLMFRHFRPISKAITDLGWSKRTYVAQCCNILATDQNYHHYVMCDLNTARKSDNWEGAFTASGW